MENDNGKSYFGIGLDNSQLEQDAAEASKILSGIDKEAEKQSLSVRELLSNIPTINIDIVTNASSSLETIDAAFAEIDRVVDTNKSAIRELDNEYKRLAIEITKASVKGDSKSVRAFQEQRIAIRKVISARKEMNKEAAATADALQKEEIRLKEAAAEAEKTAEKHVSLRQRMREVKEQLVEMEAAGERGTTAYRALQEEAGRLTDAWGDAQAQATILAHDQRGMQGLISGLQGITGAATIAQGAIGLFGGENEKLQRIMLRVQSLMAITMGLQQVQQTLNKDSAFSLVTLNGLKNLWNKLLGKSAVAIEEENAAIANNTVEQGANTVATSADTAAQTTNNTSTVAGTAAQVGNTAATKTATAATVAQTVATRAASLAMRGLKVALISTGIGALIVLVGELVGWLVQLFETTSKADKEFKEQEEITSKGAEAYAKASLEIENYKSRIDNFNGTKKQEIQLVKELNQKYGEQMGCYDSLDKWKQVLIKKGEAYCKSLLAEAEAQAILNKYTEAFMMIQEIRDKKASDFGNMFTTKLGDEERKKKAEDDAKAVADAWRKKYIEKMQEAANERKKFDLGAYTGHTTVSPRSGGGGSTFDTKKAELEKQRAIDEYKKAVSKYVKDANDEITSLIIDSQEQGLTRELNEIRSGTRQKLEAWNEQLARLAEVRKATAKTMYMNTKGATEEGWAKSSDGKKTIDDWIEVIKKESPGLIAEFDRVWEQISENGKKAIEKAQQKYTDSLIDNFGTVSQKEEKLTREWAEKLAILPPGFLNQAMIQMQQEFSKLNSDKFKSAINWESVFGDMSKQSLPVLKFTLDKIRGYFKANKDEMSTQEIKDYAEAIRNMEDEIANRNPFTALHKSIRDIGAAKNELIASYSAMKTAEDELTEAVKRRRAAHEELTEILSKIDNGELVRDCEEHTEAVGRLNAALEEVMEKEDKAATAEQRYMHAQNQSVSSYKRLAANIKAVGGVISDVGGNAKNLAAVFSDDVANSIGKALDFMNEMLDAATNVINAISDTGKNAANGIETAMKASASGTETAAGTVKKSVSTVEKASAILAVVTSALQVATAIAKLFNSDDKKQKEIDMLQGRIDQLKWELDNREAVRLRENYGDALERLKKIYASTTREIVNMHMSSEQYGKVWSRWLTSLRYKAEIYEKTIEKIADAYANVSYTADKALGSKRYDESRMQLENLAEQQMLIQQQLEKENSKKKKDDGKIQEYKNKIAELAEEMASVINGMLEDIIGSSAEDLAKELGSAFFEAAKQGEDAMEAWHDKTKEIVGDIVKRMLITKWLEPKIGEIFDKYKEKWFGDDGKFKGIDAVVNSAKQMENDINEVGEIFNQVYGGLSGNLKEYFDAADDAAREASQKGIATASQESVDELNGRMTAVQGHTYNISEYTKQLVATTNLILNSVLNIESETDGFGERLANMESNLRDVRDTVGDIALKGIKIK